MAEKEVLTAESIQAARDAFQAAVSSANLSASDADKAAIKADSAANNAISASDIDPNYVSDTEGQLPSKNGAAEGTIGAFYTADGFLQKVKLINNAWVFIGKPVLNTHALSASGRTSFWNTPNQPSALGSDEINFTTSEDNIASDVIGLYENLRSKFPEYISRSNLGNDESGNYSLWSYSFTPPSYDTTILITAGIHGSEEGSVYGLYRTLYNIAEKWGSEKSLGYLRWKVRIITIPLVNPWGFSQEPKKRQNVNGVDLNRNFDHLWDEYPTNQPFDHDYKGTAPFSELEAQYMRDLILSIEDLSGYLDIHDFGASSGAEWRFYTPHNRLGFNSKPMWNVINRYKSATDAIDITAGFFPSAFNWAADQGVNSLLKEATMNDMSGSTYLGADYITYVTKCLANLMLQKALIEKQDRQNFFEPRSLSAIYSGSSPGITFQQSSSSSIEALEFDVPVKSRSLIKATGTIVIKNNSTSNADKLFLRLYSVDLKGSFESSFSFLESIQDIGADGRVTVPLGPISGIVQPTDDASTARIKLSVYSTNGILMSVLRYRVDVEITPTSAQQPKTILSADGRGDQGANAMVQIYPS